MGMAEFALQYVFSQRVLSAVIEANDLRPCTYYLTEFVLLLRRNQGFLVLFQIIKTDQDRGRPSIQSLFILRRNRSTRSRHNKTLWQPLSKSFRNWQCLFPYLRDKTYLHIMGTRKVACPDSLQG